MEVRNKEGHREAAQTSRLEESRTIFHAEGSTITNIFSLADVFLLFKWPPMTTGRPFIPLISTAIGP